MENELPYAYEYALAMKTLYLEDLPSGPDPLADGYEIQLGEWKNDKGVLMVSVHTEVTESMCDVEVHSIWEVKPFGTSYERATGIAQERAREQWEQYKELGLTGTVKLGYYEIIDFLPDNMVLFLGKMDRTVYYGSYVQALVNDGNFDNVDYYIIQNKRNKDKGYVDGFADNTLGQIEGLFDLGVNYLEQQFVEPWKYIYDAVTGKSPDSTFEQKVKVDLGLIQMFTHIPVYTGLQQGEKDIRQLREGYSRFMEMMPQTEEEWKAIADGAVAAISTCEEEAEAVLEELAGLSSEEWAELMVNTMYSLS